MIDDRTKPPSSDQVNRKGKGPPAGGDRVGAEVGTIVQEDMERIRSLIEVVQSGVPAAYRPEVFRQLLPSVIDTPVRAVRPYPARAPLATQGALESQPIGSSRLNLARYAVILAAPGRTLLKALTALDAASEQLGIEWMTPGEIERFLVERARVRSVYRTNVSNALRGARQLVDRRRRGRGYEYRITLPGREAIERELAILGTG